MTPKAVPTHRASEHVVRVGLINVRGASGQGVGLATFIADQHLDVLVVQETWAVATSPVALPVSSWSWVHVPAIQLMDAGRPMGGMLIGVSEAYGTLSVSGPASETAAGSSAVRCTLVCGSGASATELVVAYVRGNHHGDRMQMAAAINAACATPRPVVAVGDWNANVTRLNPQGRWLLQLAEDNDLCMVVPGTATHTAGHVLDYAAHSAEVTVTDAVHDAAAFGIASDHRAVVFDVRLPGSGPAPASGVRTVMERLPRCLPPYGAVVWDWFRSSVESLLPSLSAAASAERIDEAVASVSTALAGAGKLVPRYRFAASLVRPTRAERRRVRLAEQKHLLHRTQESAVRLVRLRRQVERARAARHKTATREMLDGGRAAALRPLALFLRRSPLPLRRKTFDFTLFRGRAVSQPTAVQLWQDYCAALFHGDSTGGVQDMSPPSTETAPQSAPFIVTPTMVFNAVLAASRNKAADEYGMVADFLKNCVPPQHVHPDGLRSEEDWPGKGIFQVLAVLFTRVAAQPKPPVSWTTCTHVPLFKAGDVSEPDNYRLIALSDVLGKLYRTVVQQALYQWTEDHHLLSPLQGGFRKGRGCAGQVFLLKEIAAARKARGLPTVALLLDIRKAYDSLPFACVLQALDGRVPEGLRRAIQALLTHQRGRVQLSPQHVSEVYNIHVGVPQGGPEAPLLFNLAFDAVLRALADAPSTISLPSRPDIRVPALGYADDIVILAGSAAEMQLLLGIVERKLQSMGLRLNAAKCVAIVFGARRQTISPPVLSDGTVLPFQHCVRYLGVILDEDLTFRPWKDKIVLGLRRAVAQLTSAGHLNSAALMPRVMRLLASETVLGRLAFCLGTMSLSDIPEVDTVLASIARTIQGLPPFASSVAAIANVGWLDSTYWMTSARLQFVIASLVGPSTLLQTELQAALTQAAADIAPTRSSRIPRRAATIAGQRIHDAVAVNERARSFAVAVLLDLAAVELSMSDIPRLGTVALRVARERAQHLAARRMEHPWWWYKRPTPWSDWRGAGPSIRMPAYLDVSAGARQRSAMRSGTYDCGAVRMWRLATFSQVTVSPGCPLCPQCSAATFSHLLLFCPSLEPHRREAFATIRMRSHAVRGPSPAAVLMAAVDPPVGDAGLLGKWEDWWLRVLLGGCTDLGTVTPTMAAEASLELVATPTAAFPVVTIDLASNASDPLHVRRNCERVRQSVLQAGGEYIALVDRLFRQALGSSQHA